MKNMGKIPISYSAEESTNGLGMMMGQYIEQILDRDIKKNKLAKKLKISTTVEMDKGISSTITFDDKGISIKNGVTMDTDMHLKSDYLTLAHVISGKENPVKQILKGKIKILKHPLKMPIQTFRLLFFLKLPKD